MFPPHDLTHYTVETTFGYRHGFFGLIAGGWDISDFGAPWPRGPLPAELPGMWAAVPAGGTLELPFTRSTQSAAVD